MGVNVPGIIATPRSTATPMTSSSTTGETRNRAARIDRAAGVLDGEHGARADDELVTRGERLDVAECAGVVSVNSTMRKPPRTAASIAGATASAMLVRRIADARAVWNRSMNSFGVMNG